MTDRLTKLRQVTRDVREAADRATAQLAEAAKLEAVGRDAGTHAALAERALLSVYAKIGTLRHNGPQPEARPA